MSLREQLLKKGLVDDKRAKQVERELKEQRKREQGERRRKSEVEAERAAAREAEEEARRSARLLARKQAEAEREAASRATRVRQIALAQQIRARGRQIFFHKAVDGRTVLQAEISERAAWALRAGKAAIVAIDDLRGGHRYLLTSAEAAARVAEIDPGAVVFLVRDTTGISAPENAFYQSDWGEGPRDSARPRRATPEDVADLMALGGVRRSTSTTKPGAGR